MIRTLMIAIAICCAAQLCYGGEKTAPADEKGKESYSLGYQVGTNIKRDDVDLDLNVFLSAVRDALEGKEAAMAPDQMQTAMKQLRQRMSALQARRYEERAAKNVTEGKEFLAANQSKEGIKTLPDGLQYKVLKEGDGASPKATDTVTVNYRGNLLDGTEFDNSYSRGEPVTVRVDGVIPAWTEALPLMKVGSKWQLFVPAKLAYGERQFGRIPPNSTLLFEVELLSIKKNPSDG